MRDIGRVLLDILLVLQPKHREYPSFMYSLQSQGRFVLQSSNFPPFASFQQFHKTKTLLFYNLLSTCFECFCVSCGKMLTEYQSWQRRSAQHLHIGICKHCSIFDLKMMLDKHLCTIIQKNPTVKKRIMSQVQISLHSS